MMQNKSPIRRFEITGLHGDRDIVLDFDHPIKILVDENGTGKTTVLNILANLLQDNWHRISRYEFNEIEREYKIKWSFCQVF